MVGLLPGTLFNASHLLASVCELLAVQEDDSALLVARQRRPSL